MTSTRFTDLVGCTVPVQQAGMGGVTTPELAGAVARAGGLGMLAAAMVPADELLAALDAIGPVPGGAIGVNFLVPFLDDEALAAVAAVAGRARVVEFFYGEPDDALVDVVHAGGALASWQVGSTDEARAAVAAGCDLVVVQGTEAGGHVRGTTPLPALLGTVVDMVDMVDVPVVAAGGIATGGDVEAALRAGADAVRVGTRFVATTESGAHPDYVDAVVAAGAGDTVLTQTFSVMWPDAPHRVLRSCVAAASAHDGEVVGQARIAGEVVPIPRFAASPPDRSTTGDVRAMALYAGESVGSVTTVVPAADVMRELLDGVEAALERHP